MSIDNGASSIEEKRRCTEESSETNEATVYFIVSFVFVPDH